MSYLPFTILAYLLNSISVTIDKFLLSSFIPNPFVYTFYINVVTILALLLIPFVQLPTSTTLIYGSTSTLTFAAGLYFMFKALKIGQISRVIPLIGTLTPLALLIIAIFYKSVSQTEILSVGLLLAGLIFLTLPDLNGRFTKKEIFYELSSTFFFTVSYVLLRHAFLQDNFLTVLVYSRLILVPIVLFVLVFPKLRNFVLNTKDGLRIKINTKAGMLFAMGQLAGTTQGLLLTFSVSLADPSLVNSLQGTQYIFLFASSIFLSKRFPEIFSESFTPLNLLGKFLGILLISAGLYLLAFIT